MRLFVVGRHPAVSRLPISSNVDIETIATVVQSRSAIVARCDLPGQLIEIVKDAASDGLLNRLDLVDHGHAGILALGEDILFSSDSDPASPLQGADVASAIAPYLSDTAQIRLLGCYTGEDVEGRLLLAKLSRILGGHRLVFGVIDRLTEFHFDENGYRTVMEAQRLFSSLAALDGQAPTVFARADHRDELYRAG